ncbi:MAG: hypothetical protein Q8N12_05160 [Thermodesulfovibrionales bacterium]|nr:hypothetical protein [Thermodesulfovibrionales bacterium]MCG2814204.1 hypothetical protein [Thermodesulfovibrionales bacterium]MDP3048804.1 hypothetical protein [Thermodesulfovibrionales bacterium]
MNNFLQRVIIEPFERFFEKALQFLPDYLEKKLLKGEEKDDIEHTILNIYKEILKRK